MRKTTLRWISLFLLAVLVAFQPRPAVAQGDPQQLLIQADQMLADGQFSEGWALLETLSRDFAGQIWDAEARMHKAYVLLMVRKDANGGMAMLESIATDFPGTEVAIRARRELLDTWAARQPVFDSRSPVMAEYLQRLDAFIVDLGGSPVDSSHYEIRLISALDEESQRYHLDYLYLCASSQLSSGAISGQFSNEQPDVEAFKSAFQINLRRFELFPEFLDYNDTRNMRAYGWTILGLKETDYDPNETTFPTLMPIRPSPGAVITERRPEIVYSVQSGTVLQIPVDVGSFFFTLDGQPLENVQLKLSANLDDRNAPFMTYTRSYQVPSDLSPGVHRVKVGARNLGGREELTFAEWEFTVSDQPSQPTTETLPVTKDAIIYEKSPHSNEGANPRLTLEKITGKAARNLLGFDLSAVDVTGLTKATLVLSIDSGDQVTGWGNGETVRVQPVTVAWHEGNGKKHGLPGNQQTTGSGAGTTWFSPTDENISNSSANSTVQWSGAATYTSTGTAPALSVHNHQTGELRFDVTQDVANGVPHGWLLRKDAENKGSKVSFFSREGATLAGNAELAPRLILEYGGPTAQSELEKAAQAVASFLGFPTRQRIALRPTVTPSEGGKRWKDVLQESPRAAFLVEQAVTGLAGQHPLSRLGAQLAYRTWLRGELSLA